MVDKYMVDKYVTKKEFNEQILTLNQAYELTRKLVTHQAAVLNQKVDGLKVTLEQFMSRKPDPRFIRDAWIKQLPKIRDELQQLQLQFAKFVSIHKDTVEVGESKKGADNE